MATTADFKNGMCLEIDGNYFFIVEFLHVKPGKGPAFVRTKLRNVKTGRIIDKTWNSGVKVDEVRIERRPYQYLYKDDMGYNFMHTETFEQVAIPGESIEGVQFLKEGDICEAMVHAASDTILTCEMPQSVVLEITYTEPGIKGDTATNTLKPATVETGAEIRVPCSATLETRCASTPATAATWSASNNHVLLSIKAQYRPRHPLRVTRPARSRQRKKRHSIPFNPSAKVTSSRFKPPYTTIRVSLDIWPFGSNGVYLPHDE